MEHTPSMLFRAVIFPLAFIMICGLGAWIFLPRHKTLDITDLRKSELLQLAGDYDETEGDFYTLKAGNYKVIGKFYEDTVTVPSARHFEDVTYVYYSVQFKDRYDEPVVMAVKVRAEDYDLEKSTADITGKMVILKEERVNQQKEISAGDTEPEGIMLYETQDISGRLRTIGGNAGLISFAVLAIILAIRKFQNGQEQWDGSYGR